MIDDLSAFICSHPPNFLHSKRIKLTPQVGSMSISSVLSMKEPKILQVSILYAVLNFRLQKGRIKRNSANKRYFRPGLPLFKQMISIYVTPENVSVPSFILCDVYTSIMEFRGDPSRLNVDSAHLVTVLSTMLLDFTLYMLKTPPKRAWKVGRRVFPLGSSLFSWNIKLGSHNFRHANTSRIPLQTVSSMRNNGPSHGITKPRDKDLKVVTKKLQDTLGAATVRIDSLKNELCHEERKCSPPLPFFLPRFADTAW